MKVLLYICVSGTHVRPTLAAAGQDVVWSSDWSYDPGDEAILVRAHLGRVNSLNSR